MIKTNLIVSLDEPTVGGDKNVFSIRTTETNEVIVEMVTPKLSLDPKDLQDALVEIQLFVEKRGVLPTLETKPEHTTLISNFVYGDDAT